MKTQDKKGTIKKELITSQQFTHLEVNLATFLRKIFRILTQFATVYGSNLSLLQRFFSSPQLNLSS